MELSLFLAKLIGIYMLIVAVIMLFRKNIFESVINEMVSSPGLLAFAGIINLVIGLAIAIGHPIYELSWRGLITLIGYLSIIKGIMRLAFPEQDRMIIKSVMRRSGYWIVFAIVVILGLFLTYNGFV